MEHFCIHLQGLRQILVLSILTANVCLGAIVLNSLASKRSCFKNSDCDEDFGFTCNLYTRKCECIEANTCTTERKIKILAVHEICTNKTSVENGSEITFKCPKNSYCSVQDEICLCKKGFIPTLESGCVPQMIRAYPPVPCQEVPVPGNHRQRHKVGCEIESHQCIYGVCHMCLMGQPNINEMNDTICELKFGENCRKSSIIGICPRHQQCDLETSKCACPTDFTYYNETTADCELLPEFGEDCSDFQKCQKSEYGNIKCLNNTCNCNDNAVYDTDKGICVTNSVGSSCTSSVVCPDGSECSPEGICICKDKDGYLTIGNACEPDLYGKSCTGTFGNLYGKHQKNRMIKCIDGIYQCENIIGMRYNRRLRRCVNLPGGFCDPNLNDLHQCPKNSECKTPLRKTDPQIMVWNPRLQKLQHPSLSRTMGICECQTGFSATPYGQCLASYGSPCQDHTVIGVNSSEICNMFNGFICMNGICQCSESTYREVIYKSFNDVQSGRIHQEWCVSPTGYFCGRKEIPSLLGDDNSLVLDEEEVCIGCKYYYIGCSLNEMCKTDPRVSAEGISSNTNMKCQSMGSMFLKI